MARCMQGAISSLLLMTGCGTNIGSAPPQTQVPWQERISTDELSPDVAILVKSLGTASADELLVAKLQLSVDEIMATILCLIEAFEDDDPFVRWGAEFVFMYCPGAPEEALPALRLLLLREENAEIRALVAGNLVRYGEAAKPDLERALKHDKNCFVRYHADQALWRLEGRKGRSEPIPPNEGPIFLERFPADSGRSSQSGSPTEVPPELERFLSSRRQLPGHHFGVTEAALGNWLEEWLVEGRTTKRDVITVFGRYFTRGFVQGDSVNWVFQLEPPAPDPHTIEVLSYRNDSSFELRFHFSTENGGLLDSWEFVPIKSAH